MGNQVGAIQTVRNMGNWNTFWMCMWFSEVKRTGDKRWTKQQGWVWSTGSVNLNIPLSHLMFISCWRWFGKVLLFHLHLMIVSVKSKSLLRLKMHQGQLQEVVFLLTSLSSPSPAQFLRSRLLFCLGNLFGIDFNHLTLDRSSYLGAGQVMKCQFWWQMSPFVRFELLWTISMANLLTGWKCSSHAS